MKRGRRLAQTMRGRVQRRWASLGLENRRWRMYEFLMSGEFERWLIAQAPHVFPIIRDTIDTRPVAERWNDYGRPQWTADVEQYGLTTNPIDIRDIRNDHEGPTAREGGR